MPLSSYTPWLARSLIHLAQKVGWAPPIRALTFAELESLVSGNGFEIVESSLWVEKDAIRRVVARRRADAPEAGVEP